jgi:glycerophosphoryl diester phosphodiesterase
MMSIRCALIMQIIAHRGASHDAPENTLASACMAWEQGADALEVDVHLTRDGRLAVIHDPDTRRTAGTSLRVGESTLDELKQLDVGAWRGRVFAGERISSLEEILATVPDGKRVFIELKGGAEMVEALQRSLAFAQRRHGLRETQSVIIAFDLAAAAAVKQTMPKLEVCWLAEAGAKAPHPTLREIADAARNRGLNGIDVDADWPLEPDMVQSLRSTGFKIYVWTVDDVDVARRLVAARVDGITTNRPGWLRAQLAPPPNRW